MSKLVLLLVFLSLAFAVCVSTVLGLNSEERLSTLFTFLVATLLDTIFMRPIVILVLSFYDFLDMRMTGWLNLRLYKVINHSATQELYPSCKLSQSAMLSPHLDTSAYAT